VKFVCYRHKIWEFNIYTVNVMTSVLREKDNAECPKTLWAMRTDANRKIEKRGDSSDAIVYNH